MLRNLQPPASPFSCKAVFNYPPQLIFSPPFQITNPCGMQAEKNNFLTFFCPFESIRIISFGLSFFRRQIAPNYRRLIVYAHLGRFNTTQARFERAVYTWLQQTLELVQMAGGQNRTGPRWVEDAVRSERTNEVSPEPPLVWKQRVH